MDIITGLLVVAIIGFAIYGIYKFYSTKKEEKRKLYEQKKESMIKNVIREILTNSESNNSEEMVNRCYLDYIGYFNRIIGKSAITPNYTETLLETYLFAVVAYNNTFIDENAKDEFLNDFAEIIGDKKIDWTKLKPKLIDIFQKSLINPMMDANKALERLFSDPYIYVNPRAHIRYSLSTEQSHNVSNVAPLHDSTENKSLPLKEENVEKVMSALNKIDKNVKIDFNSKT